MSKKKTVVRGPFVLSPNTPLFVGPGDVFEASTAVANNVEGSGPDAKVKVALQVKGGLEIQGEAEQTVTIPEGREKAVKFTVKALEELGNADLVFSSSRKKRARSASRSIG